MTTAKETTVKLDEQEFNGCPGRATVIRELDYILDERYEIVDLESLYWQNDACTFVFAMHANLGLIKGFDVGKFAYEAGADEFFWQKLDDDRVVIRLWWD